MLYICHLTSTSEIASTVKPPTTIQQVDPDTNAHRDFDAIKSSRRRSDWVWFYERHTEHPLADLVGVWISDHDSTKSKLRRAAQLTVGVLASCVAMATIVNIGFRVADTYFGWIESEEAINSPKNVELANADRKPTLPPPPPPPTDDTDFFADWQTFFEKQGFSYFSASELLILGASNSDLESPCFGLNSPPPRELWINIVTTVRALEVLRDRIGKPISMISVYRSPAYNSCIGGSSNSSHTKFQAIDFVVVGADTGPMSWAQELRSIRDDGNFTGGIGAYNTFVHVDSSGTSRDWN